MTGIDRRSLLGAALGLPLIPRAALADADAGPSVPAFIGAGGDRDGGYFARIVDARGRDCARLPLSARGHGAAWRPSSGELAILARRPGRFALVVDAAEGAVTRRIAALSSRHFYGHGVFSRDGRWLFTSENDFAAGHGVIGVYDAAAGYRREAELPSHGVGPHELTLMPDGRQLVVANGGIRTHPDRGRRKLNLDSMAPNLAYIDSRNGALLHRHALPAEFHKLSIRHLAVATDGLVCLALQNEGPRDRLVPLVGFQRGEGDIALAASSHEVLRRMRHYCGSAAVDDSGAYLAVSAPRGGLITFWSTAERHHLSSLAVPDGCGLAAAGGPGRFLISSGRGRLLIHDVGRGATLNLRDDGAEGLAWDNHLTAIF